LRSQLNVIKSSVSKDDLSKQTAIFENNGISNDRLPISLNSNNVGFFRLSLKNSGTSNSNTLDFYKNFGVQNIVGLNSTINLKDSGFNNNISESALITQNPLITN